MRAFIALHAYIRPHVPGRFGTQARLEHQTNTMHQARQTHGTGQKTFWCPKQQTRVSTTKHVKAMSGYCLRVASRHVCAAARAVTLNCTHRPLRSPWAFQRRAVGGSGLCQSSTSASQPVRISARCDWLHEVKSAKAQLHLNHSIVMPDS